MIVLDENISAAEEAKLTGWGIRCRTIGVHVASKGDDDADLLTVLLTLKQPTFFSHDQDFWDQSRQHSRYCLVWLDTEEEEQARFIRALLRHPEFNTRAKRLGKVVRAQSRWIDMLRQPPRQAEAHRMATQRVMDRTIHDWRELRTRRPLNLILNLNPNLP